MEGRWSFGSREADEEGDERNPCFGGEFNVSMSGSSQYVAAGGEVRRKVVVGEGRDSPHWESGEGGTVRPSYSIYST